MLIKQKLCDHGKLGFLVCGSDEHGSGWREVPGDDPEVQHVAEHAVKTIQQRSNSLFPYELQEVVHANAEVWLGFTFLIDFSRECLTTCNSC